MRPETKFRSYSVEPFLKLLNNCAHFSIQQSAIRGDADKIVCVNGFFVWLELKKTEGKEAALQRYKASLVREANGIDIIASPENWNDVKYFLNQLSQGILDKVMLQKIKEYKK